MILSRELMHLKDQYSVRTLMVPSADMELSRTTSIGLTLLLELHLITTLESKKELKKTMLMVLVQYFLTQVISQVLEGSLNTLPSSTS